MIRLAASMDFTLIGDGRDDEVDIMLAGLVAPSPILQGMYPTVVLGVKMTGATKGKAKPDGGGVAGTLSPDHRILHLVFDIPPSSARITVDFLYGRDE